MCGGTPRSLAETQKNVTSSTLTLVLDEVTGLFHRNKNTIEEKSLSVADIDLSTSADKLLFFIF